MARFSRNSSHTKLTYFSGIWHIDNVSRKARLKMKNQDIVLAIKDALLQRLTDKINTIQDERDREVVALRALHGYNFEQIGELLGMSFEVAEARWHKVTQQWANASG